MSTGLGGASINTSSFVGARSQYYNHLLHLTLSPPALHQRSEGVSSVCSQESSRPVVLSRYIGSVAMLYSLK
jgi:hypothetical protein